MNFELYIQIKTITLQIKNIRDFSGKIFLEKASLYKYVGRKIVKII